MAKGYQIHGKHKVDLNFSLKKEEKEKHTIDNVTNNLYSMNKLVHPGISIFRQDELTIYNVRNTQIKLLCAVVLRR